MRYNPRREFIEAIHCYDPRSVVMDYYKTYQIRIRYDENDAIYCEVNGSWEKQEEKISDFHYCLKCDKAAPKKYDPYNHIDLWLERGWKQGNN